MTFKAMRAIPTSALAFVPLLALPALVGAFLIAITPGHPQGTATLIVATVVLAWYLLGGAIALRVLLQGIALRRELREVGRDIDLSERAAFATSTHGEILRQNRAFLQEHGDLVGHDLRQRMAAVHADPERFWLSVMHALDRKGGSRVDLGTLGEYKVTRRPGGQVQTWTVTELPLALPEPPNALPTREGHFDELPVALLLLDTGGVISRANAAAKELLGNQIEGRSLAALLDGPGRPLTDWISDVATGRLAGGPEVLRSRSAGPEHFVQVTLRRSEETGVTAVLSDASDLKKLEAQFAQSQKMQAIGQLAGGIAHDFNNLLTAISGHCDLLMLRHDKGDPDYADLEQINQNANRAAALVGQLLAFSRKQTLKLQMLDLRDSLSDLTHLLNRLVGERVVLTFHHDPKLHLIRADKRQLEQVIMNLVVNARDAMVDGGDVTITTGNVHFGGSATQEQSILPPGDYVCVAVQDQGCGIAPEVLDKIFEPFFSTKRVGEGTGLGLSTAYGIVKQTGGYIFCDSVVGEGSRFSLYFPAHVGQVAEPDVTAEHNFKPTAAVRVEPTEPSVLLVEDEAPVRAFASRALQLQGCKVYEASCAEEALEILSDQRLLIDVFVTDVVMPGMDGPAWVRTALRDRPATRVIFMSGYTEDIFSDANTPIPGASFLAKPFSLSDLTALVSKQLDGRERGDEAT